MLGDGGVEDVEEAPGEVGKCMTRADGLMLALRRKDKKLFCLLSHYQCSEDEVVGW